MHFALRENGSVMERVIWPRIRDILISLVCLGILFWGGWSIMGQFVHAIVLLLLAMGVAFLITPLVNFLQHYMPRALAALIVFVVILGVLGGLCYGLIFSVIQQIQYFSTNLPSYVRNLPITYANFQKWLVRQGIPESNINGTLTQIQGQVTSFT